MGLETAVIIGIVKAVAIAVASTAASYVITKLTTPRPEPIRTGDQAGLEVTTARYGAVIARGYGDENQLPGHWIWRSTQPYREEHRTEGGKHNPGTVQYTYAIDCGAQICMNPGGTKVLGVKQVKMDDLVVYPVVPMGNISINGGVIGADPGLPIIDGSANRISIGLPNRTSHESIAKSQLFEIRLGQQEQKDFPVDFYAENLNYDWKASFPDGGYSQNQDDWDNTSTKFVGPNLPNASEYTSQWPNYGVGNHIAPSYTNRVTIWFKFMDLEQFGRRLPQLKVEVVFADNTVGEVIIAEAVLAGLTAADLDVAAVASIPVRGLAITDIMPPKEVIGMLGIAHNFTMPLIDGKLKAVSLIPPGSPPTIDLGHAGAQDGGVEDTGTTAPKLNTLINEGTELPQRVEVSFIDAARNYNSNRVGWGRLTSANKGMVSFQWPMVLTPDEATVIAKRALYVTRAERIQFSGELLPKYIQYHPGDVVKIVTPEGPTHTVRITKQNFAVGNKVEFEAVRVIPSTYVQVAKGPTPLTEIPAPQLTNLAITEFWVGDMPAMLDAHHGLHGFYVAAAPYIELRPSRSGDNWFGAELWANMGGTDEAAPAYILLSNLRGNAVIAQVQTQVFTPDATELEIFTRRGARFYSMSDAQWNSGEQNSNMLMVGREVLQFRHVDFLNDDQTSTIRPFKFEHWKLTGLRRGLRGTKIQTHYRGEPAVLYDPRAVEFIPWNHSTLTFFNMRAVTIGLPFSSAKPIGFRYQPETNQFAWAVSWDVTEVVPSGNVTRDALTTLNDSLTMVIS